MAAQERKPARTHSQTGTSHTNQPIQEDNPMGRKRRKDGRPKKIGGRVGRASERRAPVVDEKTAAMLRNLKEKTHRQEVGSLPGQSYRLSSPSEFVSKRAMNAADALPPLCKPVTRKTENDERERTDWGRGEQTTSNLVAFDKRNS